ncbi:MAG: hypothetical protein ABI460_13745 [Caldimonas sp.]
MDISRALRASAAAPPASQRRRAENDGLLQQIAAFCRSAGMAESTFGRRAVNDGKFVARLRFGGKVTTHTVDRVHLFITHHGSAMAPGATPVAPLGPPLPGSVGVGSTSAVDTPVKPSFRFYDNRQKYLLFVNTCAEKWVVAQRIELELALIRPHPPAMRVFDAGVGDGTVLARVLRSMHDRMPTVPFYVVGKEISLEDVRLALEKMPDRFCEHPATVLVMTNMYYSEAPWLRPKSLAGASGLEWHEVALKGSTAGQFDRQITELQPMLAEKWTARTSPTSGGLAYDRPVVLVIYREDHKLLLDAVRPRQGAVRADFDLVIASQPYRARATVEFKAAKVIAPLARALGPGGRLVGFHSYGHDAGLEIIQRVWPQESPFGTDRHQLLKATKLALGADARGLNFNTYSDKRSIYSYQMHTLPSEISSSSIGTSTLMAAWNAAVYVAQIDDDRLAGVMGNPRYLEATRDVLQKHGKLWFLNESFVIWRNRSER